MSGCQQSESCRYGSQRGKLAEADACHAAWAAPPARLQGFFTLEMLLKIFALGLIMEPNTYMRSGEERGVVLAALACVPLGVAWPCGLTRTRAAAGRSLAWLSYAVCRGAEGPLSMASIRDSWQPPCDSWKPLCDSSL